MKPDVPLQCNALDVRKDPMFSFLVAALDSIAVGVIAVDRMLRPVHSNQYAREILDQGTCLGMSGGTLSCPQAGDTIRIRTAVARCIDEESISPSVFRLPDHHRAEQIEVAVMRGGDCTLELATIFIRNPCPPTAAPDTLLADLYGLTRAERQIASLLTQEGSVTVAAKVRGVSASTARTHLRSLLRKTGARRQVDLVQRLSTGLCGLVRFGNNDDPSLHPRATSSVIEERGHP